MDNPKKLDDSGKRVELKNGVVREIECNKGRCDLLPFFTLLKLSKQFELANTKYPERNWERGMPMHCFLDSAIRHLFKYMDGQNDEDHLTSALWNIACAIWTEEKHPEMQDIPSRKNVVGTKETQDN